MTRPWQLDITIHSDDAGQDDRYDHPRQHTIERCTIMYNGAMIGSHECPDQKGGYFCTICGRLYRTGDNAEYESCDSCYHRQYSTSYVPHDHYIGTCIKPEFMGGTLPEFVERMKQDSDEGAWALDTSNPDIWELVIDRREGEG